MFSSFQVRELGYEKLWLLSRWEILSFPCGGGGGGGGGRLGLQIKTLKLVEYYTLCNIDLSVCGPNSPYILPGKLIPPPSRSLSMMGCVGEKGGGRLFPTVGEPVVCVKDPGWCEGQYSTLIYIYHSLVYSNILDHLAKEQAGWRSHHELVSYFSCSPAYLRAAGLCCASFWWLTPRFSYTLFRWFSKTCFYMTM